MKNTEEGLFAETKFHLLKLICVIHESIVLTVLHHFICKSNAVNLLHESDIPVNSKYLPVEVICEPVVNMCNFCLVLPTNLSSHCLLLVICYILFKPITKMYLL